MTERERLTLEIAMHAIAGTGVGRPTDAETKLAMVIAADCLDFAAKCTAAGIKMSREKWRAEALTAGRWPDGT